MQKEEFLKNLAILYPHSFYDFSEKNGTRTRTPIREKMNLYKGALNGTPENFQKLYETMLKNHQGNYVPELSWLTQEMKKIQYVPPQIQKFDKTQLAPPPARFHEELEKLKATVNRIKAKEQLENMGGNTL